MPRQDVHDGTLVHADVAGIQDWIIGHATELQIVRGGSRLLDRAFEDLVEALTTELGPPGELTDPGNSGWQLIARSSGELSLILTDREDADRIAALVRANLARQLPGLTITVGTASLNTAAAEEEKEEPGFLAAKRQARESAVSTGTRVPTSYHLGTETCEATGVATAVATPTSEGWHLSAESHRRRNEDAGDLDRSDVTLERRMDRIGAATRSARYAGYVAVISADGNAIGRRFQSLSSAVEVAAESRRIGEALSEMQNAAYDAAVDHHTAAGGTSPPPLNPVVRAGDDLRFVVPAHVALPFAAALIGASHDLQACAGVLLCHATLPFSLAHEASEQLLRQAKRASKGDQDGRTPPFVAFALESGSGVRHQLGQDVLSASPCHADQLAPLHQAAQQLDVGQTQLRRVIEALRQGGRAADREWKLWWLTLGPDAQDALRTLWGALGCSTDPAEQPFPLTRTREIDGVTGEVQVSPLADLLLVRGLTREPIRQEVGA